ncbi:MAG: acyl-CoA dehydrogenase family protein, partial [Actinomycetota bacterium]
MEPRPEDVGLERDEIAVREVVRELARREARPLSEEHERLGTDSPEAYRRLAELGLTGIPFDPRYGGGGA